MIMVIIVVWGLGSVELGWLGQLFGGMGWVWVYEMDRTDKTASTPPPPRWFRVLTNLTLWLPDDQLVPPPPPGELLLIVTSCSILPIGPMI